jgi:hypothetical protein
MVALECFRYAMDNIADSTKGYDDWRCSRGGHVLLPGERLRFQSSTLLYSVFFREPPLHPLRELILAVSHAESGVTFFSITGYAVQSSAEFSAEIALNPFAPLE